MTAAPARATESRDALRLWLRLLSCTNAVKGEIRTRLRARFMTTLPRFDLLAQLEHAHRHGREALPMSELSERLMVSNGNITGLTARLVREKLVSRRPADDDRRTQLLSLTPAGRRALQRMAPEHAEWVESLFAPLTRTERRQLYALTGKLKDSVAMAAAENER